jgi:hypothetical protein
MLGTIDRIINTFDFIKTEKAVESGRMHAAAFTRDSPLNFENSILLQLNNHGLSNNIELRNYFKKIDGIKVTKQAFSDSRKKLDPNVFKTINNKHLSNFYNSNEVKTFKKHLLIAGDGSKCTLPYHELLIPIFWGIVNKFNELTSVALNLTMLYDCLNGFIIDQELDKYNISEKELMNRNIENLEEMDYLKDKTKILTFDRGFPSIEFFTKLLENDEKFLARIRKNSYKTEKKSMRTNDEFIDININKSRTNHIEDKELKEKILKIGKLNLRVTKIILPTGEEEHLISNLDKETFNYVDIEQLYKLRWEIEVSFDSLKNLLDVENVSGYSEIAVKQDFLARMLSYNIVTDIENSAQKILDEKNKNNEPHLDKKKKINKNTVIGIVKEDLIEIATMKNDHVQKQLLTNLIEEISTYYTQTSTIKSPRKPKRIYSAKNRSNNRKSF